MTGEVTFTVELFSGPKYVWEVRVDGRIVDMGFTSCHWWAFHKARRHAKRYRGER